MACLGLPYSSLFQKPAPKCSYSYSSWWCEKEVGSNVFSAGRRLASLRGSQCPHPFTSTQLITISEVHAQSIIPDRIKRFITIIKEDRVGRLAWIPIKSLALNHQKTRSIVVEVERNRIVFVTRLMKELGFNEKVATQKVKGFMFLYFGWLVRHWNDPTAYHHPEEEVKGLMEILGLPVL